MLLERAKSADAAETDEPELDIPAEIERREVRLKAITEARERLEQGQRDADVEQGRSEDDERKPRDEHGNPKGGRYKREFGVPEAKSQDSFTDPDSRIMKRAGGGFDASHNGHTAVDDTAHIIVAAELSNNVADTQQLVPMLQAVKNGSDGPQSKPMRSQQPTEGASGSPSRPTAGSRACCGYVSSVFEVCTVCKPSSSSCAWP